MKILVGGSTGLVGTALVDYLKADGHEVIRLVRGKRPLENELDWDPEAGELNAEPLQGVDAVVHLGGHNIASGRWSSARKKLMMDSRVNSTQLLSETIAKLTHPPKVFVCASAIGFYGDRDQDLMVESSAPGPDYISDLCQAWEQATSAAHESGIRVINLRIGVVLSARGGALRKMLTPFKLGLGGKVGSGKQWWSWIALHDLARAIAHCIQTESLSGPVNCVAPGGVQNLEFTKTLGRVLRRPTLFPLPSLVVRILLGEMGKELLLGSTRVDSQRLANSGFEFNHPELESALRFLLDRENDKELDS